MVEKVALAASGAWVGTTAACVICSIITFLAARLPSGLGVGSTMTGAGAERAVFAGVLAGVLAIFTAVFSTVTVGFAGSWAATLAAVLAAGFTADLATVWLSGLAGKTAGFAVGLEGWDELDLVDTADFLISATDKVD
ncbi:MAG: hypothetical protein U1A81_16975 [Hydrogenophaga sp.]|uniref:hypothetical protein n=1 Tax=Hydrogenophaga sp. TaxID=1904254 RepID=UPI002ABADAF0|nr:hypothetical protein [Hydrogenophaga sp.]